MPSNSIYAVLVTNVIDNDETHYIIIKDFPLPGQAILTFYTNRD